MKLLLDTNVFLWASREPHLLTPTAREILIDPYHERYVSMASLWEMQIKHALGKLPLPGKVDEIASAWMRPLAAKLLPIEPRHLGKLYDLPPHHRDPFDRLLIAQAISEGMEIVSADTALKAYAVSVVW
ncbi:MAG: type II toxin-antitoxin system VapC family toxin [Fimbriimonas sp.]